MGLIKNKVETAATVLLSVGLIFIFLNRHITWIVCRFLPEDIKHDILIHPKNHPMTGFKMTLMVFGWVFFIVGTYVVIYYALKRKEKAS